MHDSHKNMFWDHINNHVYKMVYFYFQMKWIIGWGFEMLLWQGVPKINHLLHLVNRVWDSRGWWLNVLTFIFIGMKMQSKLAGYKKAISIFPLITFQNVTRTTKRTVNFNKWWRFNMSLQTSQIRLWCLRKILCLAPTSTL